MASTGYLTLKQVGLLSTDASAARVERERVAEETSRLSQVEVRERDDPDLARAKKVHTYASYQRYLKLYPDGRHAAEACRILIEADQRAEDPIWTQARSANNRASHEKCLDRYPNGRYAAEAEAR